MNKQHFDIWMNSVENEFLEEAACPATKPRSYKPFAIVAAACLVLAVTGLLLRQAIFQSRNNMPDMTQLVPTDDTIIRHDFTKDNNDYTILACLTEEPADISGMTASEEPLSWYAGGLEIKLCSTSNTVWVSWYDTSIRTQWCLLSEQHASLPLLTTAKDMIEELGYNMAVAPDTASDITYDAFLINSLTVAETTFLLDGIRYSYRMAATYEIAEDFTDISGTGELYSSHAVTEVGWCPAKIYYDENGYGKIIWFDIAPGLLYSLSMETNASEDALLSLAHELFVPAQDAADW